MSSQTSSVKFTYEDYLLFPEDGRLSTKFEWAMTKNCHPVNNR